MNRELVQTYVPKVTCFNGRVEVYTHSDFTTQNKGACIVRVDCGTEFGAKTDEFIAFCKQVAQLAYGRGSESYQTVIAMFPDLEIARKELEDNIKEKVTVVKIKIITLYDIIKEEGSVEAADA